VGMLLLRLFQTVHLQGQRCLTTLAAKEGRALLLLVITLQSQLM